MVKLGNDWDEILSDEFEKPYYLSLREFLKEEYKTKTIYPNMNNIFEALKLTSYKDTKVLILGQDLLLGIKHPISLSNSLYIFNSDGGIATLGCTENANP